MKTGRVSAVDTGRSVQCKYSKILCWYFDVVDDTIAHTLIRAVCCNLTCTLFPCSIVCV